MIESNLEKGNPEKPQHLKSFDPASEKLSPAIQSGTHEYAKHTSKESDLKTKEQAEISQQVVEHLRNVVGPVKMEDPKHGAIHGTSAEAIMYMRKTGKLAGRTSDSSDFDYRPGDINIFPTRRLEDVVEHLKDTTISILEDIPYEFETLTGYANMCASEHHFLTALGIPLTDSDAKTQAWFILSMNEPKIKDIPVEQIKQARTAANERKGFLLGFSPTIKEDFKLMKGDPGGTDMRIQAGKEGMPYSYISGIQPLGPHEEKLLEEWGMTEKDEK